MNESHFVVTATVNGELLYGQAFHTMLDAIADIGDLMFHDDTKRITVEKCRCADQESHRAG